MSETFQPCTIDSAVSPNAATSNYGSSTSFSVGYQTTWGTYGSSRALLQWDELSDGTIPNGSVLNSVDLYIYAYQDKAGSSQYKKVYRITASWDEMTVTWNNKPAYDSTVLGSTLIGASDLGWQVFSLSTTEIAKFINGTYNNYGFVIKDEPEGSINTGYTYYSSEEASNTTLRPKLVVDYIPPGGDSVVVSMIMSKINDVAKSAINGFVKKNGLWVPQNKGLATI